MPNGFSLMVNYKHIAALLDSGSLDTLVKPDVIAPVDFHARKMMADGITQEYPIVISK